MKKEFFALLFILKIALCHAQNISRLIAEAEDNLEKNHWEQAYTNYKSLLETYVDDLTYHQRGKIYNHLGFLDLMFLEPGEAEKNLNLSILYHEEAGIPDEKDFADALINMGMLYLEQVEFDLARRYTQRALDILEKRPEYTVDYLIARTKLARIYEEAGSLTLALSIYNTSYDNLVAMGNELSPDFADICSHKGRILILTGKPTEGEKFINLSTTIYESLGAQYNVQRAESMEDLALFYERMGRYDDAENMLLEILELKRSIPDEADILIIETLNDLGIMYHRRGKMSQAEKMFNEVVAECEENVGTDHPFYATAKNNLGTIAINKGDFTTARDMLEDALTTYKAKFGSVHPYYANTLNNLARVERKLGNNATAEKYYQEVLRIDNRIFGDDHPNYATTLLNIGVLFSSSGREAEAEDYYAKALQIRERTLGINHPSYGSALEYMGMHYLATENLIEAEQNFRKSIGIQISQIKALFPIMTEGEREAFYQGIKDDIDRYNYIASKLLSSNPELIKNIFDFQAKTKTVLFNTLNKVREVVEDSEDDLLKAKYDKWISDRQLLASYYQMGVEELADLHVNLTSVENDIENQETSLTARIESFEEALVHDKIDWRKVQASVKPEESLVEIVRIREYESLTFESEKLYGFTDNTKYLAIIFNYGEEEINYVFLGEEYMTDKNHYFGCKDAMKRESVYQTYWKPIVDKTGKSKVLRVVPDGIYYKVNPNSMTIGKGKYVIDKQFVSYITSVHDLFRPDPIVFNNKSYLFGTDYIEDENPNDLGITALSGIEKEINQVGSLFANWKVNSYLDMDASELRLRSAYNPTVLHIASHGFFDSNQDFIKYKTPFNGSFFKSGLYLNGVLKSYDKYQRGIPVIDENDGILTSYEAMNLDLDRTRLVFLSSLVPMPGEVAGGEGMFGLVRAFMVAGARNVITSIDKVDVDLKSELLELFYNKFIETDKIEESFRYAQLELRKKYDDPEVWGSFIITGNGS